MQQKCLQCDSSLGRQATLGICPRCLMGLAADPSKGDAETASILGGVDTDRQSEGSGEHTFDAATERFGDYEIIDRIAQGGMGVVYRARHTKLDRECALKLILSGQFASQEEIDRFVSEAQLAAKLEHPGIVAVYEVGEVDGQYFLAMALVEGVSLAERSRQDPLPVRAVATIIKRTAQAIDYAHQRGIVHRDIKPANILLDENDAPRLTDFGVAKEMQNETGASRTSVVGTPAYMPPEHLGGDWPKTDPRSDVYSLGVVFYELLTGEVPFRGKRQQVLHQIQHVSPVRPRVLDADIPRDLETLCLKCLEKNPAHRFETAGQLGQELQRWNDKKPILSRPIRWPERTTRWVARHPLLTGMGVSLFLVTLVGLAGIVWQWRVAVVERTRADRNLVQAHAAVDDFLASVLDSPELLADGPEPIRLRGSLLRKAEQYYRELIDGNPGASANPELQSASFQLGRIYYNTQQLDDAAEHFAQSAILAAALYEQSGEPVWAQRNVESLLMQARSQTATVGFVQSEPLFRKALALRDEYGEKEDLVLRGLFARTWLYLSMLQQQRQQWEAAKQSLRHGLQDLDRIGDRRSLSEAELVDLCEILSYWSVAELGRDRIEDAREYATAALARLSRNQSPEVERPHLSYMHAKLLIVLARAQRAAKTGDARNGITSLVQAVTILERLCHENPAVISYRTELADALSQLAGSQSELGRFVEAVENHRLAVREFELISGRISNSTAGFRADQVRVNLSIDLIRIGQVGEARQILELSRKRLEEALRRAADPVQQQSLQRQLALACLHLGRVYRMQQKFPAAIELGLTCVRLFDELAPRSLANRSERALYAEACASLGDAYDLSGNPGPALDAFAQAIEVLGEFSRRDLDEWKRLDTLASILNRQGLCHAALDELSSAEPKFAEAIEIYKRLLGRSPESAPYEIGMAGARINLAGVLRRQDRPDDALKLLASAKSQLRDVLTEHPRSASANQFLANAETIESMIRQEDR